MPWVDFHRPLARSVFLALVLCSCTRGEWHGLDLDAIAARPDTTIVKKTEGNTDILEIESGGVNITSRCIADHCETWGVDNSGHGAVACSLQLYIITREELSLCHIDDTEILRRDLDTAIGRINEFVVANNLTPTTKAEVEEKNAKLAAAFLKASEKGGKHGDLTQACRSKDAQDWIGHMRAIPHDKFVRDVDDLLSVPRPPVMNPCL